MFFTDFLFFVFQLGMNLCRDLPHPDDLWPNVNLFTVHAFALPTLHVDSVAAIV